MPKIDKDISEIKVSVARIEEHIGTINSEVAKTCQRVDVIEKFNYKLVGASAVVFFILDLGIKILFKI